LVRGGALIGRSGCGYCIRCGACPEVFQSRAPARQTRQFSDEQQRTVICQGRHQRIAVDSQA